MHGTDYPSFGCHIDASEVAACLYLYEAVIMIVVFMSVTFPDSCLLKSSSLTYSDNCKAPVRIPCFLLFFIH